MKRPCYNVSLYLKRTIIIIITVLYHEQKYIFMFENSILAKIQLTFYYKTEYKKVLAGGSVFPTDSEARKEITQKSIRLIAII